MREDSGEYCMDITRIEITMIDKVDYLVFRMFHVKH